MNSISRKHWKNEIIWIIVALCLILQLFSVSATFAATTGNDAQPATSGSSNLQDPLSWEQSLANDLPGPGAFLDSVLGKLSRQSDDSEDRLKQLWAGTPNVVPDLFKVFITL